MNPLRGVYDPLADRSAANYSRDGETPQQPRIYLEAYKPSELRAYQVTEGHILVGTHHIQKGAITVMAGPPDVGKSRAALSLAAAGAIGSGASWFGLPIHCQFRTLLLQNENGLARLHDDFIRITLPDDVIDQWIRVTPPPPFGMLMDHEDFRAQLRALIMEFKPHLLEIDPWNSVVRDIMERDYHQAFVWIREVLADLPETPAVLIIHHLRKPRLEDRAKGTALVNLMAGSYTIFSVPRCAMILQRASDSLDDNCVVFTPVKNNDGDRGKRSAWELRDGEFFEVEDFDWEGFDAGSKGRQPKVIIEHLREIFDNGATRLKLAVAVEELERVSAVRRTTAYDALKTWEGRFSEVLEKRKDGTIGLVENEPVLKPCAE